MLKKFEEERLRGNEWVVKAAVGKITGTICLL